VAASDGLAKVVATTKAAAINEAKANRGMMEFRKRAPAQGATGWAAQVQDKTTGKAATNRRLPIPPDPVHPGQAAQFCPRDCTATSGR
jgi:hypothetical protein